MPTGRILQFDEERGFGFIAADDGDADIFLHASDLSGDSSDLAPGVRVEFELVTDDRGRKAFAARVVEDAVRLAERPDDDGRTPPAVARGAGGGEGTASDGPSRIELDREVTELLLESAPGLTAGQLLRTRQGVVEFARRHGWVDA